VCLGDLTETLASRALLKDSNPVDVERTTADMPAFQPGPTHAGPHPLDDEISLEFGDGPDDDDDGPPSGPPVSRFSRKLTNSMFR
jgi:hypothetical protein